MGDITEMHYRESWSNTQCTYRHAHAHARTHTHARTCTHTHTHMHMHTCACTHTHTHTHARTHAHTHTQAVTLLRLCAVHTESARGQDTIMPTQVRLHLPLASLNHN